MLGRAVTAIFDANVAAIQCWQGSAHWREGIYVLFVTHLRACSKYEFMAEGSIFYLQRPATGKASLAVYH